ncbi:MAG: VTT domain-containing protein, partial [Spirochaetota bacterium]
MFEKMLGHANHLGLFAEETGPLAMASGIGGATFFSPRLVLALRLQPEVAIGTARRAHAAAGYPARSGSDAAVAGGSAPLDPRPRDAILPGAVTTLGDGAREERMTTTLKRILALLPILLLVGLFGAGALVPEARALLTKEGLVDLVERAGLWAPVVIVLVMAVAIVVSPLPNVPVSAVLGMIYGSWAGTALAVTGAILGASAAFLIARHVGMHAIRVLSGRQASFCADCSERALALIVFGSRLIPVVSFDMISYGAGLSALSFWRFFWASLVGMVPWTFFYTTVGAAVLDTPVLAAVLGTLLALAVLLLPVL